VTLDIPEAAHKKMLPALRSLDIFDNQKEMQGVFQSNPTLRPLKDRIPNSCSNRALQVDSMIVFLLQHGARYLPAFLGEMVTYYRDDKIPINVIQMLQEARVELNRAWGLT
jgi:hypothetical protein